MPQGVGRYGQATLWVCLLRCEGQREAVHLRGSGDGAKETVGDLKEHDQKQTVAAK